MRNPLPVDGSPQYLTVPAGDALSVVPAETFGVNLAASPAQFDGRPPTLSPAPGHGEHTDDEPGVAAVHRHGPPRRVRGSPETAGLQGLRHALETALEVGETLRSCQHCSVRPTSAPQQVCACMLSVGRTMAVFGGKNSSEK